MKGHARKWVERSCELANITVEQWYKSLKSLLRRLSIQTERTWICWRNITSVLSNCLEMPVSGQNWTCSIRHQVDRSLRDLEDSKSTSGESYVFSETEHLFSLVRCAINKRQCLTVPQNRRVISLGAGLRVNGLFALDLWDEVMEVLRSSNSTKTPTDPAAGNCSRNHKSKPKKRKPRCWSIVACGLRHTTAKSSRRVSVVHLWTKQWSKWSFRVEVQRWDTCQERTELRLIDHLTESTWNPNPNQICWHQEPTWWHVNQR